MAEATGLGERKIKLLPGVIASLSFAAGDHQEVARVRQRPAELGRLAGAGRGHEPGGAQGVEHFGERLIAFAGAGIVDQGDAHARPNDRPGRPAAQPPARLSRVPGAG